MNSVRLSTLGVLALLAFELVATSARGSDSKTPVTAKSATAGSVAIVPPEPEIPQSVFVVTNRALKDPFFPNSTRVKVVTTNAAPTISASLFVLNGLSGPTDARLAMINGRTVAAGEDAVVNTSLGKMTIHCVEIKESSALIRIPGQAEPIELRFRM